MLAACCLESPSACGTARCALLLLHGGSFLSFSDATAICKGGGDNDRWRRLVWLGTLCIALDFVHASVTQSHVLPALVQASNPSWLLAVMYMFCRDTEHASRREQRMRRKGGEAYIPMERSCILRLTPDATFWSARMAGGYV